MLTVFKVIPYVCFIALFAAAQHIMKDIDCCTYAQEPDSETKPMGQAALPFSKLDQASWINEDNDTLSTTSDNVSLRVNVQPASSVNETVADSPWNVISTDFIPIKGGGVHNYSLDISANNANRLHSKVIYYDLNKNETSWEFIFSGRNGTFNDQFSKSIFSPPETEYLKLQMLVRPSLTPSFYVIDGVKIEKVPTGLSTPGSPISENATKISSITSKQSKFAVLKFDKNGTFIKGWGSEGSGKGQFLHPHGISVDSSDNVYVTDQKNCNVQKFSKEGEFITSWPLDDTGKCSTLESLAVDPSGYVYVANLGKYKIDKFTDDGKFITSWGSKEPGDNQIIHPWGVTVDSSGNLLITEEDGIIKKFTPDGKFITKWGSRGNSTGQFQHLHDIELDSHGNMYVVDQNNFKILKFTKDGEFIKSWGSKGGGEGEFTTPYGIAIDSEDNIHLVDRGNHRIQEFDSDGNYTKVWASDDSMEAPTLDPHGMDVDSSGNFYVVDSLNAHEKVSSLSANDTMAHN